MSARGAWVFDENLLSRCTLFQLNAVLRLCFEQLQVAEVVPPCLGCGYSTSLRFVGYRQNSGRIRGLRMRPHLPQFGKIATVLRGLFHGRGGAPLKRPFEWVRANGVPDP